MSAPTDPTAKLNPQEMLNRLACLSDRLREEGIKHWLDFGALLGAVRQGQLIEGDPDIDLDLLEEDLPLLLALKDVLRQEAKLELFQDLEAGMPRAFPVELATAPVTSYRELAEVCRLAGVPYIDFYPCKLAGRQVLHFLSCYHFRRFFIERLDRIVLAGQALPAPRHAQDLLNNRYGKQWRVPMPRQEFQHRERALVRPLDSIIGILVQGTYETLAAENGRLIREAARLFERVVVGVKPPVPPKVKVDDADAEIVWVPYRQHITRSLLRETACHYIGVDARQTGNSFTCEDGLHERFHPL